jgi:hypothetical protein
MTMKKRTCILVMTGLMVFITSSVQAQQHPKQKTRPRISVVRPVKIETALVLPEGQTALDAGLAMELDREWRDREYDNIRFAPVGIRSGVAPGLEIGGFFGYSSNDDEDLLAPDESGLEGISVFGKLQLNRFAAVRVGLNVAGDDDVFPYPSDEIDLFANLALQRTVGKGLLCGEFGYTTQGGDLDTNNYFNYGIGYAYPASDLLSINVELTGEEDHAGTFGNTLDLLVGANLITTDGMRLSPFVTFGLNDASPDFSIGGFLEVRF